MPNLDIWHAANLLIQVRGTEKAEQEVVRNAARLRNCGEVEGQSIWLLILSIYSLGHSRGADGFRRS
jgi:hypothetical protein